MGQSQWQDERPRAALAARYGVVASLVVLAVLLLQALLFPPKYRGALPPAHLKPTPTATPSAPLGMKDTRAP
jgi:hypothetical protein